MKKIVRLSLVLAAGIGGMIAIWQLKQCPASQDAGFKTERWLWAEPRIPLEVTGFDDDGVREGLAHFNGKIGCKLVKWVDAGPADVIIEEGSISPGEVGPDGRVDAERAFLKFDPTAERSPYGIIEVRNVVGPHRRMLAVGHGFTHIFGLAHDRATNSLAHQYVLDYAESFPMPVLSDQDADLLREEYCP
jgi:hypothetical protein